MSNPCAIATCAAPTVSVIVSVYNGAAFLDEAVWSARRQSLSKIEIVIVDDASCDDSFAIAQAHAAEDCRVTCLRLANNQGPASARNVALAAARGEWIAILDSDDIMHPLRLAQMLYHAEAMCVDIVADDSLVFFQDGRDDPYALLARSRSRLISLSDYIQSNVLFGSTPALGYLKPMFRRVFIEKHALRYDETLRIAEDYDLIARCLANDAAFLVIPTLTYFYRKHSGSISYRLDRMAINHMISAQRRFVASYPPRIKKEATALDMRLRSLKRAAAFEDLIVTLRKRRLGDALKILLKTPSIIWLLRHPLHVRLRLILPQTAVAEFNPPSVAVICTETLMSSTLNPSPNLMEAVVKPYTTNGFDIHFIVPWPSTRGRRPVLILGSKMRVFRSVRINGYWHLGRLFIAKRVNNAVPSRERLLFLAQHARPVGDVVAGNWLLDNGDMEVALRPKSARISFSSRMLAGGRPTVKNTRHTEPTREELRTLYSVDVCICTFQRASLWGTLQSIAKQKISDNIVISVIVADNDVVPSAKALVEAAGTQLGLRCRYVHAPFRNIAIARNACLDTAKSSFAAFIDDDEIATEYWLSSLLSAQVKSGDEFTFGPVKAIYPTELGWLAQADLHSFTVVTRKDGKVVTGYTSNVLINRDALTAPMQLLRFDPELGRTGGEDTTFFHEMYRLGARLGSSFDAIVTEAVPSNRANLRWLLTRSFRSGQTHARLLIDGQTSKGKVAAIATAKLLYCMAWSCLRLTSPAGWRRHMVRGALHAGVIARLAGFRELRLY